MTLPYQYTPYIWLVLASAAFIAAMGIYAWRHRTVPGAYPFTIMTLFLILMTLGAALEMSTLDASAKIFWAKFQGVCYLPIATAELCFVLDYANLGRWLTRRTLILLAIPPLVVLGLALTNDAHHLLWLSFSLDEYARPVRGIANWIGVGYAYLLAAIGCGVLLWLFVRSPLRRWPVALCIMGQIIIRAVYLFEISNTSSFLHVSPLVLGTLFATALYAIALFRFQLFNLIPAARQTVIEQMYEGMLVLDTQQRIVDLNPAAEKILGLPGAKGPLWAARARGQKISQVLPACPDPHTWPDDSETAQSEINLVTGGVARSFALHLARFRDQRGFSLGYLILLHDVTEQKRAQAQLLEQQRARAMIEERARLARELHDGQAQVLGYIKMRAQVARDLLAQGQAAEVDAYLANLIAVAQDAHTDIREYLLGVRATGGPEPAFLGALQQYLQQFSQNYGIRTELHVSPDLHSGDLVPTAEVQLLRIIQEILTNARKHAQAARVQISASVQEGQACFIIQDDGQGFDPDQPASNGPTFGLRFMRERAEDMGGDLAVHSTPGQGTCVTVWIPLRK